MDSSGQTCDSDYLINNDKLDHHADNDSIEVKILKPFSLPFMRYNNLMRLTLLADGITCVTLWLAGGNSVDLRNSVFHFTMTTSVFDLACLAMARMILLFLIWTKLEDTAAILVGHPLRNELRRRKAMLLSISLLFTLAFMAYSLAKLIILYLPTSKMDREAMHSNYVACAIASVVFVLIECLLAIPANSFINRVGQYRNFNGSKGKANLRRVLSLAKEVRRNKYKSNSIF